MWKTIAVAVALVLVSGTAEAHKAHGNATCFEDTEALWETYPLEHAYYKTIEGKKCWHVHKTEKVTKIEKPQKAKKIEKVDRSLKYHPHAEPDEQKLRNYLGLDCEVWIPTPVVLCHQGNRNW